LIYIVCRLLPVSAADIRVILNFKGEANQLKVEDIVTNTVRSGDDSIIAGGVNSSMTNEVSLINVLARLPGVSSASPASLVI
jgi:hypothetical protein